jgi:mRNA-degrading endonuclease RelE of RelBE toxin-antitoxin system
MSSPDAYEIRLAKAALKQLRELSAADAQRVRSALREQASRSASSSGARGGKSLKSIRGRHDRFFRLRAGELRVMFDLLDSERVLLVHAIVNRRDLERWLRGR